MAKIPPAKMKRLFSAALASVLLLLAFSGCGGEVEEYSEPEFSNPLSAVSVPESSSVVSSAPEFSEGGDYESTGYTNRLTGQTNLPSYMLGKRPVAVVLNNYVKSLPHNGISLADVVVEAEAEGGITRLLALYADWYDLPKVGSVREARLHFLDMAQSFDAIMISFGASSETTQAAKIRQYTFLNAMNFSDGQLSYRDEALLAIRNREHTVVTEGKLMKNTVNSRSIREDYLDTAPATYFKVAAQNEIIKPAQYRARSVFLPVGMEAEYKYDSARGVYLRYCAGAAQTDLNTGEQVAVTNVCILFAQQRQNSTDESLVTIELTSGEGYYFTMGRGQKIYWQREGAEGGRIVLYDDKGAELALNQGRTWVNIIPKNLSSGVTWTEIG